METMMDFIKRWIEKGQMLFVAILFIVSCNVEGQVDKRWLKSWNEANKMKPTEITSYGRIASQDEQGKPLVIKGKIHNPDNTPAEDVLVHSYHRDSKGFDFGRNDSELSTWRLQSWARTDRNGNFEFKTIRPAPDHIGREGPHIHFTTVSEKYGRQWAPTVYFSDDPLLTEKQRNDSKKAGKFGWISEVKEKDGIQYIHVNFKLKKSGDF